jgi:hypothetical protein
MTAVHGIVNVSFFANPKYRCHNVVFPWKALDLPNGRNFQERFIA